MPILQRLTATLVLLSLTFPALASMPDSATYTPIVLEQASPPPASIHTPPMKLAHAECGHTEFSSAIISNQLSRGQQKADLSGSLSDSLFVNMVLQMAYQRDPEIMRLLKKLGRLTTASTISAFALTTMGLSASIISLSTINGGHSASQHSEEEHDHRPEQRDNPAASVLGVASTGLALVTLTTQTILQRKYGKQLALRQSVLRDQVTHAIDHLNDPDHAKELDALIGPRAAHEFRLIVMRTEPTPTSASVSDKAPSSTIASHEPLSSESPDSSTDEAKPVLSPAH